MSTLHEFDATSMSRDCTCGWQAEARTTVDEARAAWQQHINEELDSRRASPTLDRASIPAMSDCTCNSAFGVDRCPFHGYAKGVSLAPEPKMQRALAEGEFNVVGDELRKMNERLEKFERDNTKLTEEGRAIVKERGERLTAIESQLTALRAEADKGRESQQRALSVINQKALMANLKLDGLTAPRKKKQERKRPARKNR